MSGGSYDYACFKIEELASSIRNTEIDPRRAAFAELLKLVAAAAHDIEWVDSCDYGKGDEHKTIDVCFAFLRADPETIIKARTFDQFKDLVASFLDVSSKSLHAEKALALTPKTGRAG